MCFTSYDQKVQKVSYNSHYIEHFLILASTIIGCISTSAFSSLLGIPRGVRSSALRLKICATAAGVTKYKSIIKKKKKKHNKKVLLAKSIVLKEYDNMEEEIKNLKT